MCPFFNHCTNAIILALQYYRRLYAKIRDRVSVIKVTEWGITFAQKFVRTVLGYSMWKCHWSCTWLHMLLCSKPVVIYQIFKELATRLSIALFLSHNIGREDAREISELMTTHWRGIISVPLPIKLPFYGWRSGYSKALTAKDKLLKIITSRLTPSPSK